MPWGTAYAKDLQKYLDDLNEEQSAGPPPELYPDENRSKPMPEEREQVNWVIANCPFCGCDEAIVLDECDCWSVLCNACDAEGPPRQTEEQAVSAWNKRCKLT